jgi:hypothetical protein
MTLAASLAVAGLVLPRPAIAWQDWSGAVFGRARAGASSTGTVRGARCRGPT